MFGLEIRKSLAVVSRNYVFVSTVDVMVLYWFYWSILVCYLLFEPMEIDQIQTSFKVLPVYYLSSIKYSNINTTENIQYLKFKNTIHTKNYYIRT